MQNNVKKFSFRLFLENQSKKNYDSISAYIPVPNEVEIISKLFQKSDKNLFIVGGAVRDYLYQKFHLPGSSYQPKDIDLTTDATPEEIINILSTPDAKENNIKIFPKGEQFGIISAIIDGKEYEIATFRKEEYDAEKGDGRRPDKVEYSTIENDAKRRDLTINALYYDINNHEIRDYNLDQNGEGLGIKDIKNKLARPVGNPFDRFREDKLRIIRLVRFFSRLNDEDILNHLSEETMQAVLKYNKLEGVSKERIAAEFIAGIKQALKPAMFLHNCHALQLFSVIFPKLNVNVTEFDNIGFVNNPKPVIAWILKNNGTPKKIKQELNNLKYSSSIFETVEFLLELLNINKNNLLMLLKKRDSYKFEKNENNKILKKTTLFQDIRDFGKIANLKIEMEHFINYEPIAKSENFNHLPPQERSKAMAEAEFENYTKIIW